MQPINDAGIRHSDVVNARIQAGGGNVTLHTNARPIPADGKRVFWMTMKRVTAI